MDATLADLSALRGEIDAIDGELVRLLGRRFAVTRKIGALKAEGELPARDAAREAAQSMRLQRLAEQAAIDPELATRVLDLIRARVVAEHEAIASGYRSRFP